MKKITVIGGGTGTFVVLSGLKDYELDLSVVVSMMDSGGSTGKLRDQLGVLPPGDLRQCLVALSDAPILWRKLFLYRFETGDFKGHNFGNLFLAALEKVSTSYDEAIQSASYVLKTKGKVFPVTHDKLHLAAEYENGKIVTGEGLIDENHAESSRIKRAYLTPSGTANVKAVEAIENSDYIIVGPGDLYTSIIPVLLVEGIGEHFQRVLFGPYRHFLNHYIPLFLSFSRKYASSVLPDFAASSAMRSARDFGAAGASGMYS